MHIINPLIFCLIGMNVFSAWGDTVGIYTQKNLPKWQVEMNERAKELEQLQKQNGYGTEYVKPTDFPKTTDDLSFSARVQLEKESLEPYKDLKAYREYDWKSAEDWCPDHLNDPGCEKYKAKAEKEKRKKEQEKKDESGSKDKDGRIIFTI